ncbi:MAG TPA: hypothetical protein DCR93_37625, partial [Cytophagales bacterium]|nr:hypothetical protein [Cytophagales bacterium]
MVPAQWRVVPAIPMTINGKVDRRKLTKLQHDRLGQTQERVAPSSAEERQMATIWQAELQLEAVGILDDFFEIGGDSIKAIRVLSKVKAQLGRQYSVAQLFATPTIAGLLATEL